MAGLGQYIDKTGLKYGMLTVIELDKDFISVNKSRSAYYWKCKCDCGNIKTIRNSNLRNNGGTKSCGCLTKCSAIKPTYIDGRTKTKEYKTWLRIKNRCSDINRSCYGGRGIAVCERWKAFDNFLADMGNAPTKKHSIDRIDVNGNYEPSNCRWATLKEQSNNRRANVFINYNGETKSAKEWSELLGISLHIIYEHNKKGISLDKILNSIKDDTWNHSLRKMDYEGQTKSIIEWSKYFNIPKRFFYRYTQQGKSISEIVRLFNRNKSRLSEYNGEHKPLMQWATYFGFDYDHLLYHCCKGKTIELYIENKLYLNSKHTKINITNFNASIIQK